MKEAQTEKLVLCEEKVNADEKVNFYGKEVVHKRYECVRDKKSNPSNRI